MSVASSALIAAPSANAPSGREAQERKPSAQFSYALAAAGLEANAAQSLKTHGARPNAQPGAKSQPPAQESHERQEEPAHQATTSINRPGALDADHSAPPPSPNADGARTMPTPPAVASAAPQTVAVSQASVSPAKSADAAAAPREALLARTKLAAMKAPRAPSQPPTLKAEFAEILARRLEKTSVFDLRLDPPEMGRVEGRLSVADDGKAVLALAFDNQNAFDLYSRDEAALREALVRSGLDFAAGDFVFAFRERDTDEVRAGVSNDDAAANVAVTAAWSAGALDIRI